MLKNLTFSRAGAVIIALAISMVTAISSQAQKIPPAELGLASIVGDQLSGSSIQYRFDLLTRTNGELKVQATIKGKKLKGTFATYTINPPLGVSTVTGSVFTIPSTFTGRAVVTLKVFFNNRRMGSKIIILPNVVTPPPPPPPPTVVPIVSTNIYDVGFENLVTLDGSIVTTAGLTNVTYAWTPFTAIASNTTLSSTSVVSPTFTTHHLTNFVNTGIGIYVSDIDDSGYTNQLYVTPEHRFDKIAGIALDAEQTGTLGATYGFRLIVSAGSVTRTGLFTVACSSQTPAHPNIPVGVIAYYKGATNSTNWSLIRQPVGSTATLAHTNGLIAQLRPDVEGIYVVEDNITLKTVTNTAGSWVGVKFCNTCHGPGSDFVASGMLQDLVTPWSKTHHATKLQRELDGVQGAFYAETCIKCHSVGYDKTPTAVNGGFDDVQAAVGWKFPSLRQPGTYSNGVPDALKAVSNIQCENCHGPGIHPGAPSVSLDVRVCASCHQDGSHHVRPEQWEISPHAGAYENISTSRGTNPQCARCHSPVGYTAVAKGAANVGTTNSVPTGAGPLTCQTCHDPHDKFDNEDRHQLRTYDTALLGNPYFRTSTVTNASGDSITTDDLRLTNSNLIVTGLGNSATCIACHNGRQLPTQTVIYGTNTVLSAKTLRPTTIGVSQYYQVGGPHDQTAGEAFLGVGMYDYGQETVNSFHTYAVTPNGKTGCVACHMYQLQAGDTILTNGVPVSITSTNLESYANVLGNHTFKMNYVSVAGGVTNVVENIAACNQCHDSTEHVDSFDFKSVFTRDYDGNGVIEGIQTETQGILNHLGFLLKTTGVTITTNASGNVTSVSTSAGYATNNVALVEAQSKAAWNFLAVYREGSFGVHNTQYTTKLLQTSYTDLSTNWFSDASKTYQNTFTNAFLR